MSIELVPLCEVHLTLTDPIVIPSTPAGTRLIVPVTDGVVTGERLSGTIDSQAGGDWLTLDATGIASIDVRVTIRTDDGALVFVQYQGRGDMSGGPGAAPLYVAPRFEAGDERYTWLNKVQAVGKGILDGADLTYELYEIR